MLWTWPTSRYGSFMDELDRIRRGMDRVFEPYAGRSATVAGDFPAVNVWANEDDALLTAEIPGVDPNDIEVSVKNDTVTIRGSRKTPELAKGEAYIRRERGTGSFVRTFALPFHVDSDKVVAEYRMGVLQLRLPRREADKPKRISVKAA